MAALPALLFVTLVDAPVAAPDACPTCGAPPAMQIATWPVGLEAPDHCSACGACTHDPAPPPLTTDPDDDDVPF